MNWLGLDLRDVILVVLVLAAVYAGVMLLRLVRMGKRRPREIYIEKTEKHDSHMPLRGHIEPGRAEPLVDTPRPVVDDPRPAPSGNRNEASKLFDEADKPSSAQQGGGFGESLAKYLERSDMEMELQRMRDEMARMRAEVESLRNARHVSPQYAEAVELAQRGATVQDIADQLGISRGEAELVHALSRGGGDFSEGEKHGSEEYAGGIRGFGKPARTRSG